MKKKNFVKATLVLYIAIILVGVNVISGLTMGIKQNDDLCGSATSFQGECLEYICSGFGCQDIDKVTYGNQELVSSRSLEGDCCVLASDFGWEWAVSAGGTSEDTGWNIAVTNNGDIYVTGEFGGTATFGPFTLVSQGSAVFVAKLNSDSEWQWAKSAGGTSAGDASIGYDIAVDYLGNVYITGSFEGTAIFGDTTLISQDGWIDVFVAKIDTNGNWQWAKRAGGPDQDVGYSIAVDNFVNVYITGYFDGETATFGDTTLIGQVGYLNMFIAKLNADGVWQWAKTNGGTDIDVWGYGVAVDVTLTANINSDDVYITGYFTGVCSSTVTFGDITLTGYGLSTIFVAKLDTNGNWQWAKSAGGDWWDLGHSAAVDYLGNVYITGYFSQTATFGDFYLTSHGDEDIFIAKLDANGEWQWAVRAGGPNYAMGCDITVDHFGNVYITGYFWGTATFGDTTLSSLGNRDVFVAKLDTNGDWQWAKSAGGINGVQGNGVAVNYLGNVYITGGFAGTATFGNTDLVSQGNSDVFVAKLSENGEEPPVPYLSCTGSLNWFLVKPGETVYGEFNVFNAGEPESLLNWEIESYPDWGDWDFDPEDGVGLTPEEGHVTVTVQVVVPENMFRLFIGQVIVVNSDDPSNFHHLLVVLLTPFGYQSKLMMSFQQLGEQFDHSFPVLKYLLGV